MAVAVPMISDALAALVSLQQGLTITSPKTLTTRKAFPYLASPNEDIPPGTWQNEWAMGPIDPTRMMVLRDLNFTVRMQFVAGESSIAELSILHEIATHFWEALVQGLYPVGVDASTFAAAQSLGGVCTRTTLAGGDPTVGLVSRGNKVYVGAEGFLTIYFTDFWDLGESD